MDLTDNGNAKLLIEKYGGELAYCPQMRCWYIWDGRKWVEDESCAINQCVGGIADHYKEILAALNPSDGNYPRIARHIKYLGSWSGVKACIELAKGIDNASVHVDMFDRDPMRLNIANGVLDLNDRKLHKPLPNQYITKCAAVSYVKGAKNDVWLAFLSQVIPDVAVRDFVQVAVGYSLTGAMEEDCMFLLQGGGCNGKTTFVGAILNMLGDYGAQASSHVLTQKRTGAASNEVFVLKGRRFVAATETGESHALNEELVKQMTGGERLSVNPKYRTQMEFYPTWKVWLSTNHEPIIKGNDDAIWRRIIKVPFNVTITAPNPKLKPRLLNLFEGRSGILNWALEGLYLWRTNGLIIPPTIDNATKWYRVEQDLIGQFLNEKCIMHPSQKVTKTDLYIAYKNYCISIGESPKTKNQLTRILKLRGISDDRKRDSRVWIGINLGEKVSLSPSNFLQE